MQNFDVAIVGGGMIGMAVACGLRESNLRVAILKQEDFELLDKDIPKILRVSAINFASKKLLTYLGVWSDILQSHAASFYRGVEIWEKDGFCRTVFDNESLGYSHLGYIIENLAVKKALYNKIQQSRNVTIISPIEIKEVEWKENAAFISLENSDVISTKIVIGADGANSWLRNSAKIPITFWHYGHHALITTVRTSESHCNIARQIFYGDGILAFLPLRDPYLSSIVWSLEPDQAKAMKEVPPEIFNQAVYIAFDGCLGLCSLEGERQTFPLFGRYALQFASHRLALVGDAAHTIHPLAGQGANLGFMDAAALIGELLQFHLEGKDIGQHFYLRRYERIRKHRAAIMLAGMEAFRMVFSGNERSKKILRNLSLIIANYLPHIKSRLLDEAMGFNDLPNWLR